MFWFPGPGSHHSVHLVLQAGQAVGLLAGGDDQEALPAQVGPHRVGPHSGREAELLLEYPGLGRPRPLLAVLLGGDDEVATLHPHVQLLRVVLRHVHLDLQLVLLVLDLGLRQPLAGLAGDAPAPSMLQSLRSLARFY